MSEGGRDRAWRTLPFQGGKVTESMQRSEAKYEQMVGSHEQEIVAAYR